MTVTHIWVCVDRPGAYQTLDIDDSDRSALPELVEFAEEQIKEFLPGDHVHVFNAARPSPKGVNVFHECPGKAVVFGDNIVLGEE